MTEREKWEAMIKHKLDVCQNKIAATGFYRRSLAEQQLLRREFELLSALLAVTAEQSKILQQ